MKKFLALVVSMMVILGCGFLTSTPSPTAEPPIVIQPTPLPPPTAIPPTAIPPTAAPLPTAGPQQYFTEEFENGPANWSTYYMPQGSITKDPIDKVKIAFENGTLQFEVNGTYIGAFALFDPFEYTDVRLDAHMENYGHNSNDFALMCRYSQDGWYEFNIESSGMYFFNYVEVGADGKSHIHLVYMGGSTVIRQDANDYGLVCQGDTFSLYINGEQVKIVKDNSLRSGKIGVQGFSLNVVPVKIHVDWVKISQP